MLEYIYEILKLIKELNISQVILFTFLFVFFFILKEVLILLNKLITNDLSHINISLEKIIEILNEIRDSIKGEKK